MSKHAVHGGDVAGLLARFSGLQEKAQGRAGRTVPIIVIQKAGLDGFWIHRVLEAKGSKVTLSIPPRSRRHGDAGEPKPISSTARPWFARCLPINAANHRCAP